MDGKRDGGEEVLQSGSAGEGGWKVGEVAGRMGLSVRTLHHYDEVGLLSPSGRTEAGHRLYSTGDVLRLQQVRSLRSLGLSLTEIRGCLEDPDFSVRAVIGLHLSGLKEQIRQRQELLQRLEAVDARLRSVEEVPAEELVRMAMEVTEMSEKIEKHYTPEQLEYLRERRRELGEERIREVEAEWPGLMQEVRAEMERGTDPADERVQRLAGRWMELVEEFTGGDPGIARSAGKVWEREETVHGVEAARMRALMGYVQRALAASGREG